MIAFYNDTKLRANASKHKAMSYAYAQKWEEQIQKKVDQLLEKAKEAEIENEENGLNVPDEISRREVQLEGIRKAKAEIEKRANLQNYEQNKEENSKSQKQTTTVQTNPESDNAQNTTSVEQKREDSTSQTTPLLGYQIFMHFLRKNTYRLFTTRINL